MQKFVFFLALCIFIQSCTKDEKTSLSLNVIQIDGQDWAYSASCGLVRTAGFGSDIYVKIDGQDGSSLYLILPNTIPGAYSVKQKTLSAGGYNLRAGAEYYFSSSVNSPYYQTDILNSYGEIELLAIDSLNKTLNLRIDIMLKDGIAVKSGILQNIGYDNISAGMTYLEAELEKNQETWHISEYGADMYEGKVKWFFYSSPPAGEQINFNIPWSAGTGVYQLTPADSTVIFFPENTSLSSWKLKSGQIQLETVDFCKGSMRGNFQAVFQTPDIAFPQIEFNDVRFEVRYDFQ